MSRFSAEREADEKARLAEQSQQDADMRALLGTASGRRFFWRLVDERCGALSGTFAGEATHETAYREGRRSVARDLITEAQRASPQGWLLAMQEAMAAQRAADE